MSESGDDTEDDVVNESDSCKDDVPNDDEKDSLCWGYLRMRFSLER